ncbi:hypothetical protein BDF21DRAFT_453197 [Thamnidium elegans]|nr:hypothetical protein BDF21DRAFT_453197 [Thamnidium elegans]
MSFCCIHIVSDNDQPRRSECYSAAIRKLKDNNEDISQQREDFILRSNHDGTDYLSLEEKPTDQEAHYDFKKGKRMQRHMVKLWSDWLGSTVLLGDFPTTSYRALYQVPRRFKTHEANSHDQCNRKILERTFGFIGRHRLALCYFLRIKPEIAKEHERKGRA